MWEGIPPTGEVPVSPSAFTVPGASGLNPGSRCPRAALGTWMLRARVQAAPRSWSEAALGLVESHPEATHPASQTL